MGWQSVATLLCLVVLTTPVSSEVYRWVDESGKVHFSDEPRGGEAEEKIELTGEPRFRYREDVPAMLEPRQWNERWPSRKLVVLAPIWERTGSAGRAFFGSDCVRPASLNRRQHADWLTAHLPDRRAMRYQLTSTASRLRYRASFRDEMPDAPRKFDDDTLFLEPRVVNLSLELCWGSIDNGLRQRDPSSLSTRDITRRQLSASVEWRAIDNQGETLIRTRVPVYVSGQGSEKSRDPVADLVGRALGLSLEQWLSRADVAELLWVERDQSLVPATLSGAPFSDRAKLLIGVIVGLVVLSFMRQLLRR